MESAFDVAGLVGHRYRADDFYEVGREKIREYARAVQDFHPAHWSEDAAGELGYAGLIAPTTFISTAAMLANRRLLETVMTGYDMFVQTDQVFEMYKPVLTGDQLISDVELSSIRRIAGKDLLTITNTFTDQTGDIVQIMHTTVVGITSEDVNAEISDTIERVIMSGLDTTPGLRLRQPTDYRSRIRIRKPPHACPRSHARVFRAPQPDSTISPSVTSFPLEPFA